MLNVVLTVVCSLKLSCSIVCWPRFLHLNQIYRPIGVSPQYRHVYIWSIEACESPDMQRLNRFIVWTFTTFSSLCVFNGASRGFVLLNFDRPRLVLIIWACAFSINCRSVFTRWMQGCPIRIPKNPEISEADRTGRGSTRIKFARQVQQGRGVVAETSKKKSVHSYIN